MLTTICGRVKFKRKGGYQSYELKKAKKGFTLVELVVVIAIIAVLSTVSVVGYFGFTKKANISGDKALVSQLNTILKAKETETGSKPETATEAIGYVE